MAKKVQNLQKLETEILLQQSKLNSLALLDKELESKILRLQEQRSQLSQKAQRLKYAIERNQRILASGKSRNLN